MNRLFIIIQLFPLLAIAQNETKTRLQAEVDSRAPLSHTHTVVNITNFPTIPTNTNQLTNGAGFLLPADITGKANVSHTHGQSDITNLVNDLAGKQAILGASSVTNTMLAGSIDASTKLINVLPFSLGGISGAAATSATTGAMTVNMTTSVITITPTGACTFNASGGVAGQVVTFSITTSGTSSFVLTFGTNFRKVGTLATGTTSARFFSVTFICINGTIWQEVSRTAAQT